MKTIIVIPAHLASVRFPRKILHNILGLPMIEHVRRRALLSKHISNVDIYIATCDQEIADTVKSYNGNVIMTSNTHTNGTSRVAEAVKNIDCSHVILLQGDEPLLLPNYIDKMIDSIDSNTDNKAWNLVAPLEQSEELDRHSFVKCHLSPTNKIISCFRKSPCFSDFATQATFTRKILGIIAYRKEFLLELANLAPAPIETAEFIEQMRIIENNHNLYAVNVEKSLPSINEPNESDIVIDYLNNNHEQKSILNKILGTTIERTTV